MEGTGTGLSASDVALLNDGGLGNNSFIWLFAILALMGGGFGGWGNNGFANAIGYENLSTSNEVQRGFDNQNTMANQREILAAVNAGTAQSVAATNQTFHDTVNALSDKYSELARDIAGVQVAQQQTIANQNDCCCATKQMILETSAGINAGIAQNRYDAAMIIVFFDYADLLRIDDDSSSFKKIKVHQQFHRCSSCSRHRVSK